MTKEEKKALKIRLLNGRLCLKNEYYQKFRDYTIDYEAKELHSKTSNFFLKLVSNSIYCYEKSS